MKAPTVSDYWLCYVALLLVGALTLIALGCGEPRLWHWFVVPVFLCLMVVGLDTTSLAVGQVSLFSPIGLFGLIGVHFFFLVPLLNVYLDYWMQYTVTPADWRPWLGGMAVLNLIGLIAFRIARSVCRERTPAAGERRELDFTRLFTLGGLLLVASAGAQTFLYLSFGGIGGFIATYELGKLNQENPLEGMGRLMMLAETFPVVAFMMFAAYVKARRISLSSPSMILVFVILLILCLYFGGLKGSRSNTVWIIFWAVIVTHCWLRPLSGKLLLVGSAGLLLFMYGYGLYKGVRGAEGLADLWEGRITVTELEERSEKPLAKVLLQDLGRGDVQALILQRVASGMFEPVGGRTYLAGLAKIVPRSLWPGRPPNKLFEGSELRFGQGSYSAGYVSHFVHGLAGEAMINFGPLAVVPAFFVWGCAFARICGFLNALDRGDPRALLAPFLVMLSFQMLTSDLDNLLWFLIKLVALPGLLLLLSMRREALSPGAPA